MKRGWCCCLVPNWDWAREFLVVACVLSVYFAVNIGSADREQVAMGNAEDLISLERSLGIFLEAEVQGAVMGTPLVHVLWAVYIFVHPVITAGFIVVAFLSGSSSYPYVRNVFVIFSLVSFAIFFTYPVAPPRLLPGQGFVDMLHSDAPVSYHSDLARLLLNPYAAMPSVHFGYSLIIGAMLFRTSSNRLVTSLGIAYPLLMIISIVASANHLIVDALASVIILAIIYYLLARLDLPARLIRIFKGFAGIA